MVKVKIAFSLLLLLASTNIMAGEFSNYPVPAKAAKLAFGLHLDEATGSIALDVSTHAYNAAFGGTGNAIVTGILGNSVSLNGNGYLLVTMAAPDTSLSDFTWFARIKMYPGQVATARAQIAGAVQGGCCNYSLNLYGGKGFTDALGIYRLESNISFDSNSQIFSTAISTGVDVAVAWRRINCQETSIWINGKKVGSAKADCATLIIAGASPGFYMGSDRAGVGSFFVGEYDEVRLVQYAASDGEIVDAARAKSRPRIVSAEMGR